MAAGLSLREAHFEEFKQAFESVAQGLLSTENLTKTLATDGTLDAADFSLQTAQQLDQQVWGQGFAAPIFEGEFEVIQQRIVGEKHLKLKLTQAGKTLDAMHFFCIDDLPPRIYAAYKLSVNEYNGKVTVQLILECYSEVNEKYKSA
jgi:single-stranded-DNA-specific exonuclease